MKRLDYVHTLQAWNDIEVNGAPTFTYYVVKNKVAALLEQAIVLTQKYDVVVTNPPYLASSRFSPALDTYVKKNYPDEKADLSAVMFKKAATDFVKPNGFVSFITTSSWMFLSSFEKFRTFMMCNMALDSIVDFGTELFDGKVGHNPITAWVNRNTKMDFKMTAIRLVDYCYSRRDEKEPEFFKDRNRYVVGQDNFSKIPGSPVAYWINPKLIEDFNRGKSIDQLSDFTGSQHITANNEKYLRFHWEVRNDTVKRNGKWAFYAKGGEYRKWYGNLELIVRCDITAMTYYKTNTTSNCLAEKYWYTEGITYSAVTSKGTGFRYYPPVGAFDKGGATICYLKDIYYILALLNSTVANYTFKLLNPTINLQVKDVKALPIIMDETKRSCVDTLAQECIGTSQYDWDSFETSWDFAEHPLVKWSHDLWDGTSIGATMAYYYHGERPEASCPVELCYLLWQGECNDRFAKLKANEEELNRIFIDIYGLQDELTPEVEDKDVTVRRADLGRDIRSLISYAVGCIFGRYSLDQPGLAYAGGDWNPDQYHTFTPDADNVIPITDEEYFTDDLTGLFVAWVKKAFGQDYLEQNLAFIAKALGTKGTSPRAVIRNYFLNGFYADHVKIYQKRPIYWLYDSGKQNGFKALIYMHRYNADTSGLVRADYLYKMEQVYESEIARMDDAIAHGASREVAQATKRKEKLVKQLKECKDYDDRLGHIALARIPIDLDDGVKVNYEKVQTGADGKKQAILAKI